MKVTFSYPSNSRFQASKDDWKHLKGPKLAYFNLLSVLATLLSFALCIFLWSFIHLDTGFKVNLFNYSFTENLSIWLQTVSTVGIVVTIMIVHELIHGAMYPGKLFSKVYFVCRTSLGIHAYYDDELDKTSFLVVILAPYFFLSIFPLLLGFVFPSYIEVLSKVSLWNALFSGGDILSFYLTWKLVPSRAILRNYKMATYIKVNSNHSP
jgi:uncharacterized BrkB/YihY/UPF0761 family membrane protein